MPTPVAGEPLHVASSAALSRAMARYCAGDERAFDELYALLAPRLYAFCLRLTNRRDEADDLLQESMLKLHRSRASYSVDGSAIAWSYAIARSVHFDRLRHRRRRPEVLAETDEALEAYAQTAALFGGSPEGRAEAMEVLREVQRVLERLPESQREAFLLLKEEGLSVAEAAAVAGTTEMAVKLRAHRAYEALRAALAKLEKPLDRPLDPARAEGRR